MPKGNGKSLRSFNLDFPVGNDDSAECTKGPSGLHKLLLLPLSKFFNMDILSSRNCHFDSFINCTDLYHMQLKEPCGLLNFVMYFP